jgi:transcriptional regulator with XRE-family HTH domain
LAGRGLTARALAEKMGMNPGTISRVLTSERQAGPEFCAALAGALGVPADEVFYRAGLLPPPPHPASDADDPSLIRLLELATRLSAAERRRLTAVAEVFLREEWAAGQAGAPPTEGNGGTVEPLH